MARARAAASTAAESGKGGMRSDLIIAMIGLVGVVFTGLASNWDKLFHQTVTARYEGYTPTGDFETEMRIFIDKSGLRAQLADMQNGMFDNLRKQIAAASPDDPDKAERVVAWIKENSPSFDDLVAQMIPIWRKYLTLDQVQELNRFYSTPQMREMIRAMPQVTKELMPSMLAQMAETQRKLQVALVNGEFDRKGPAPAGP